MGKLHARLMLLWILSFFACTNKEEKNGINQIITDVGYVPLREVQYAELGIKPGEELKIIGTVRAKENKGDTIYYYQFITIDKEKSDTIVVLCPQITVTLSSDGDDKTATSPLTFDVVKGVTTTYFEPIDTPKSLLLNTVNAITLTTSSADINHLLDTKNEIRDLASRLRGAA